MTIDKAISVLQRLQEPEAWEPQINKVGFDALEMAIDALKAQRLQSLPTSPLLKSKLEEDK